MVVDRKATGIRGRSMTRAYRNCAILSRITTATTIIGGIGKGRKEAILRTRMMISRTKIAGLFHQVEATIILESVINLVSNF